MTPTETAQLVVLMTQLWPGMRFNEYTADAWQPVLEDLPFAAALRAVQALSRSAGPFVTPSDIRKQMARDAGLLPPPEGEAMRLAACVAGDLGSGRGALPDPVRRAYDLMGGSQGFLAPDSVIRPQFGRIYKDICEEYVRDLLIGDLGAAIEKVEASELECGRDV